MTETMKVLLLIIFAGGAAGVIIAILMWADAARVTMLPEPTYEDYAPTGDELTAPVAPPHGIGLHHHLPPYVLVPTVPEETGELTRALESWERPPTPGTYQGGLR